MSRFSRKQRQLPELNTSSLPDLIFTVLFFFMIVTTMRSVPLKVGFVSPEGKTLSKIQKNNEMLYILAGYPVGKQQNPEGQPVIIQVADQIVPLDKVSEKVAEYKDNLMLDEQEKLTVVLKIDRHVPMGIVNDIKMALRKADVLKVHYTAASASQNEEKK
jgi:biopolymer transport protein ExbD